MNLTCSKTHALASISKHASRIEVEKVISELNLTGRNFNGYTMVEREEHSNMKKQYLQTEEKAP